MSKAESLFFGWSYGCQDWHPQFSWGIQKLRCVFLMATIFALGLSGAPARAETVEQLPVVHIWSSINGKGSQKVKWPLKIQPLWSQNQEGGLEFFWALQLELPPDFEFLNVQAKNSEIGIKTKKAGSDKKSKPILNLGLRSVSDEIFVALKNKSQLELKIVLDFNKPLLIEEGCEELYISFEQRAEGEVTAVEKVADGAKQAEATNRNGSLPLYLAYRCEETNQGLNLAVTVPKEIQWVSNSMFEVNGKGRNWKNFEFGVQFKSYDKEELGRIQFDYLKSIYTFSLVHEKTEIARPISAFAFSIGFLGVNLKTPLGDDQRSNLASFVSFELRPFGPKFSFGGQNLTSVPSVNTTNQLNHTEALGFLGYSLKESRNWYFEPRVYIHLASSGSQRLNQYAVTNNMTMGGVLRYNLTPRNQFVIEGFYTKVREMSDISFRFSYGRRNRNQSGGWGFSFLSQIVQASKTTAGKQTFLGPFIEF